MWNLRPSVHLRSLDLRDRENRVCPQHLLTSNASKSEIDGYRLNDFNRVLVVNHQDFSY